MCTTITEVLEFLTELHLDSKLGYSAMNTARSALSSFITLEGNENASLGSHPLISRFFRGIFNTKPPKPRYTTMWDANIVLNYLKRLSPAHKLGLRDLTLKTCMLIALLSAQRQQTLTFLKVDKMRIKENSITFYVDQLLKQSRPGNVGTKVVLRAYAADKRLCVYKYLLTYLKETKSVRNGESQLFVSYRQPYQKVSKDTIARWIKTVMRQAGVDTELFKAHSTRSASVSKADAASVPLSDILATAGWSSARTFATYYNKPISNTDNNYANALLE